MTSFETISLDDYKKLVDNENKYLIELKISVHQKFSINIDTLIKILKTKLKK